MPNPNQPAQPGIDNSNQPAPQPDGNQTQSNQSASTSSQPQQETRQQVNQNPVASNNQAQQSAGGQKSSNQQPRQNQTRQQAAQAGQEHPYQFPNVARKESRIAPGMNKPLPEEVILEWTAPSRPFKKREKKYFSTILIIAALISLILFFAGQVLPVAVVFAIVFLVYVLSVTPPREVINKITTYGVRVEDALYYWQELGRFWFTEQFDDVVLNIETVRFPWRITLLLPDNIDKEDMRILLSEVLLNQQPKPTLYEKWADWLKEKVPLDE